ARYGCGQTQLAQGTRLALHGRPVLGIGNRQGPARACDMPRRLRQGASGRHGGPRYGRDGQAPRRDAHCRWEKHRYGSMSVDPPRVELFAHGNEDDVKKPLRAGRPDLVKQDTIARGPRWQPYFAVTVEMVPSLEMTPEWYAVTSSPYYEQWKKNL